MIIGGGAAAAALTVDAMSGWLLTGSVSVIEGRKDLTPQVPHTNKMKYII